MRPETLGILADIRDAAQFIADDTSGVTYETFATNRRVRQLVLYNFMIIGEAVNRMRRLDPDVADKISAVQQIVGLRNALIHGYQDIDYPTVWHAVAESLPVLAAEVTMLLQESDGESSR